MLLFHIAAEKIADKEKLQSDKPEFYKEEQTMKMP